MDFEPNSEQQMLIDQVRRYVREEIIPLEAKLDPDASELDPADYKRLTEKTKAMGRTKVDWQLHAYGGAVHAFTNPEAGTAGNPAFAYNAEEDRRSWSAMLGLLQEAFA